MRLGSKAVWLAVVVMGVVVASSAALLKQPESGHRLLVPLGFLLLQLAALALPLKRAREVPAEVSPHGEPKPGEPRRER
ncbi:hypothetical protein [Archangium sp.]|uniref:hypothetical protein n=1 Tax=Archangium sp. TaxID=1872627 RepID=UPI00389A0EA7